MLPTALMMELYDHQISNEEFERLLAIPDDNNFSYDPYKPMKRSSSVNAAFLRDAPLSPVNSSQSQEDNSFAKFQRDALSSTREDNCCSSSITDNESPSNTNENVSYWQDLEVYSASSDDENRPKSNLSWTSLDNNKKLFPNNFRMYSRSKSYDVKSKYCSFCFHNREKENVYTSHALRDDANNITCPALFEVVCRYCGATGSEAHTPKFCPKRTFNPRRNS